MRFCCCSPRSPGHHPHPHSESHGTGGSGTPQIRAMAQLSPEKHHPRPLSDNSEDVEKEEEDLNQRHCR